MSHKLKDLTSLKNNYIGKQYFFLTVEDVILLDGKLKLQCKCKCGKTHLISVKKFGRTKSCGCYQKSDEYKQLKREYNLAHKDELLEKGRRYSEWCKNNKDKLELRNKHLRDSWDSTKRKAASDRKKQFYNDNPDEKIKSRQYALDWWASVKDNNLLDDLNTNHSLSKHISRINNITEELSNNIHPDDLSLLLSGDITVSDKVRSKCPICGKFDYHNLQTVFYFKKHQYNPRLCSDCYKSFSSSKYEDDIYNYISFIYDGECIRNSRNIISPLELDLYYPEKKIAIEFNGDYFHSDNRGKNISYHYNKYVYCRKLGIRLISIFEYNLLNHQNKVLSIIKNAFTGISYDSSNFVAELVNSIDRDCNFIEIISSNYKPDKIYKIQSHNVILGYVCINYTSANICTIQNLLINANYNFDSSVHTIMNCLKTLVNCDCILAEIDNNYFSIDPFLNYGFNLNSVRIDSIAISRKCYNLLIHLCGKSLLTLNIRDHYGIR